MGEKNKIFHKISETELIESLGSNPKSGLSQEEATTRLAKYGPNELEEDEKETFWDKIKEQFEDRMVRLLLSAAVISFLVSIFAADDHDTVPAWVEPTVIVSILIANGTVGIYQDYNAEKATEALKKLQSETARVLREGKWSTIKSSDLVPGDIVHIQMGDKVPADCRLVQMNSLSLTVNQSSLTGENKDVSKDIGIAKSSDIIGQSNMIFSGTLVCNGNAHGIVCYTGMSTELGEIQSQVKDAEKDTEEEKTPLGEKLDDFGQFLEKSIFYV